jgi:hypothetical protein
MTSRVQQAAIAPLGYVTLHHKSSTGTVAKGVGLFSDICISWGEGRFLFQRKNRQRKSSRFILILLCTFVAVL